MTRKTVAAWFIAAAFAASAIALSLLIPQPLRAQLNAPQTWAGNAGGSANALTLTVPNIASMADLVGVPVRFVPQSNNAAGGTTINVNVIGNVAVLRTTPQGLAALSGGDFVAFSQAEVVYDGTQFVQRTPSAGLIPPGMIGDFALSAPLGWLTANGTCISQTTYAALYVYFGSSDIYSPGSTGGACAGGQFHLPFLNGRMTVAFDTQGSVTANVLTNAGSGCAATAVAVNCGAQNKTILQANIPNYNLTVTDPGHAHSGGNPQLSLVVSGGSTPFSTGNTGTATTGITVSSGGSGTALAIVPPVATVLKAIKY